MKKIIITKINKNESPLSDNFDIFICLPCDNFYLLPILPRHLPSLVPFSFFLPLGQPIDKHPTKWLDGELPVLEIHPQNNCSVIKYSWALHQNDQQCSLKRLSPSHVWTYPGPCFSPFLWLINLSDSPVSILLDCFGVSCEVRTYCKIQVGSHNTTLNLRQKIDMVSYLPGISNPRTEVIFKIQDLLSAPNC